MRHVAASVFKRLERLEQAKSVVKHIGAWGDIEYDLDKWSALAEASQAALVLKALEREPEPGSAPKPNPMDVSYKYKTNLHHAKGPESARTCRSHKQKTPLRRGS